MLRPVCFLLCVCLLTVGCGGSGDATVATVDGAAIGKGEFEHWLGVNAKSAATPGAQVPDPPGYERCVSAKRKQQRTTAAAELTRQCREEYAVLRDQTMRLLITFRWFQREAEAMGLAVSDREVARAFDAQRRDSFPRDRDFRKFLAQTGQTREDILARVRLDLLSKRIRKRVEARAPAVTEAAIAGYYAKEGRKLAQPERRDLRVVVTASHAEALKARDALAAGRPWASVARRHSIDEVSSAYGGELLGQVKGTLPPSLDRAVFSARRNALSQPVKTSFGYYVFTVTGVTEPRGQTLDQARDTIRKTLEAEGRRTAVNAFVRRFKARWKQKTDCREGYATMECRNGPKDRPRPPEVSILD